MEDRKFNRVNAAAWLVAFAGFCCLPVVFAHDPIAEGTFADGFAHSQPEAVADRIPMLAGEREGSFRRTCIRAAREAVRDGTISRREALQIRIGLLSPSFRATARNLAVVEMSFGGEDVDDLPRNAAGEVETEQVNWQSFFEFLKDFLPVLLELLVDFGIIGGGGAA